MHGNLVAINVGRFKGVKVGMIFVIHRGDEYVAKLQIDQVELDQAAGVIVDRKSPVKVGDKVINRLPVRPPPE